jgi:hypothetical protein
LKPVTIGRQDVPTPLRAGRQLASGRELDEQLSVVPRRGIAAADHTPPAKLGEDASREREELAHRQIRERLPPLVAA